MTNAHTRRMVMNDVTEYNAAVHNDPALYYRSGRPKLSVGSVPTEFRNGLETAEEGARGH
ncbi:hypothetical protein ACIA8H_12900 [Streptomyces goshikiensis]|uniref:hypothetical protein n=1 Tax=Streptomyces goshikiensis TaxID=1942 RepID=UPI0037BDA452